MLRFFSIIVLLLIMTGCNDVQTSEVVGTWIMKEESREYLPPEVEKSTGKITVLIDGTFVAHELPGRKWHFDSGKYVDKWEVISGSGNWKFTSLSGGQKDLYLWFNKLSVDNADEQDVSYGFSLFISRWWSTIDMHYSLYDPDQYDRVEFEKITQ